MLVNKNKGFRKSVSAESLDHYSSEQFTAKIVAKSVEVKDKIRKKLTESFLFNSLGDKEFKIVIDAMEIIESKPGDKVIE